MAELVSFKRAYYIKLGRGGEWEQSSIDESKLRIGWGGWSLQDINICNWEKIRRQLLRYHQNKKERLRKT